MKKFSTFIPLIILFALLILLWRELFYSKPNELPSALIGEAVPTFQLHDLFNSNQLVTQKDLLSHVSLVNVWASWCDACRIEHPMLMKISKEYRVPIYGINYKDNPTDAQNFMQQSGNPYVKIGQDLTGNVAIDFGVYGTPETFVVNAQGKIIYRHIGVIDDESWNKVLYPLIKKLGGR